MSSSVAWLAAMAVVAVLSVVVFQRLSASRHRRTEVAAWHDASAIAELMRAAVVRETERWVTRDLATPIASLLNNLGAARRLLASGERAGVAEAVLAVDEARADGERAALAIRCMPEVLGTGTSRREPLDLNAIAREALRLVEGYATSNRVKVSAQFTEVVPTVEGDTAQLSQIALSLMLHAIAKAATSPLRTVHVRTATREGHVELAISDSRATISEIDRAQLFAPVSPLTPDGLGLGLATIQSLVEAHGGWVAAERPEAGARFRVVLPAAMDVQRQTDAAAVS